MFGKVDMSQKEDVSSLGRFIDLNSTKTLIKRPEEDGLTEFCCLEEEIKKVNKISTNKNSKNPSRNPSYKLDHKTDLNILLERPI